MHITTPNFKHNARAALADDNLQGVLTNMKRGFVERRHLAVDDMPEFEDLRDAGRDLKNHVLAHLDLYLERFEANVTAHGGHVHWARDGAEARDIVLGLCRDAGARSATKSKSMIAEEIELNDFLSDHGVDVVETDLGEYIVQLAGERPSHLIAPAAHKTKEQVADLFVEHHAKYGLTERLTERRALIAEARAIMRQKFLDADIGITGANFLIAETGSTVLVTNEGNADLTQALPKTQVVLASLEKVVPTLEDMTTLVRLLARSATGQEMASYTTVTTGPRRAGDQDGPDAFHVVLLDNGRSKMLGTEFQDMLRCIRCGACLNHCPIYGTVGGHAYGWVYPGPMGAVLTPALVGLEKGAHLPNASTFCGRCESVCPMRIPLPKMMRHWRQQEFARHLTPARFRAGLAAWRWLATRPVLYGRVTGLAMAVMAILGRRRGRFRAWPFASGWTDGRDMPAPQGATFRARWRARN